MHANQAVIFHRATMDHGIVADRHILANGERVAGVDVTGDVVLDIGAFPNGDGFIVCPQHRIEPDTDIGL